MLEWIPDRPAICHDATCTLDVLIRITPPWTARARSRPELNLTLVIDRSGSMSGEKIALTRQAAARAVCSLTPRDHLGIVLFDDRVQVLVPCSRLLHKQPVLDLIETKVLARGSTALFDGWRVGADQGDRGLGPMRVNRVLLLTDGQANVGETNPDRICDEVHRQTARGLQTTTIGFGSGYNEELLSSMAASGAGNHFFVERPEQLRSFFELELDALAATVGTRVRLWLKPLQAGVSIESLGEAQAARDGAYELADLIAGHPMQQLFRITLPHCDDRQVPVTAELWWHSPESGDETRLEVPLELPRVSRAERLAMPVHPEVERQLAVAAAARARREATAAMNAGEWGEATRILEQALETRALPEREADQLRRLYETMQSGDQSTSNKLSTSMGYAYSRSSVTLKSVLEALVELWRHQEVLPVRWGGLLEHGPAEGVRPWNRWDGMLRGLFAGEVLGRPPGRPRLEGAELALVALGLMHGRANMVELLSKLSRALAAAPVARPSPALLELRQRADAGMAGSLEHVGAHSDAGAMSRVAPLLLSGYSKGPGPAAARNVLATSCLTHRDAASAAACLGYAGLLWDLMLMTAAPHPHWYARRFLELLGDLECESTTYEVRAPRYDGWRGRLSEFVALVVPEARSRSLSVVQAVSELGSGDSVLEVVPTLIYILECHGHEPAAALAAASPQGPCLASLVGAAVGALHGAQNGWRLEADAEQAVVDAGARFA